MKNWKFKIVDRFLALTLAFVMVIAAIPITAFAGTEMHPDEFTFTVRHGKDEFVDYANISYDILVDGSVQESGSVNVINGEAVIEAIRNFTSEELQEKTVEINYLITKDGYNDESGMVSIDDIYGNIDITMIQTEEKDEIVEAVVNVNKTGDGTILINDSDVSSISTQINSEVNIKIIPDSGCYIKNIIIENENQQIENNNNFEKNIIVSEDTEISVVFVRTYNVSVEKNAGGVVKLDNEEKVSKVVDENAKVNVFVNADEGYRISGVTINGAAQNLTSESQFADEITVTSDTVINVTFVKIYTVTISYDNSKGRVTSDPDCSAGTVIVEKDTNINISAKAEDTFRIAKVCITGREDEEFEDNRYSGETVYNVSLTADKDYTIEIVFEPKIYRISLQNAVNGNAVVDMSQVNYNGSAVITIIPNAGYRVGTAKVNGVDVYDKVEGNEESDSLRLEINNITEDKNVSITYVAIESTNMSLVTWNYEDAIRSNDRDFVFSPNKPVEFKAENGYSIKISYTENSNSQEKRVFGRNGNAITFASNNNITAINISKIEVYYNKSWHEVLINRKSANIKIAFDKLPSNVDIKPEQANEYGVYNDDVTVDLIIQENDDYSGIQMVEYWIECDGKETKRETIYSFADGDEILKTFKKTILVSAEENNSSDVKVYVRTVDNAGNEATNPEHISLDIDKTKPNINVSYTDDKKENAKEGYFLSREAKIEITERTNHFDADAAVEGIVITALDGEGKPVAVFDNEGNEIRKAYTISDWVTSEGQTPDEAVHTAIIKYEMDANYTFEISYTDKAGNVNNEVITDEKETPYKFTVDTVNPQGKLAVKEHVWDTILKTLTFGLYSKNSVTVNVIAVDKTSPVTIEYYKTDSKVILTEEDLDMQEFEPFTGLNIDPDELFTVYLKITDYAGNSVYISSDGCIVEDNESNIVINPEEANENGIYGLKYKDGIRVDISVTEEGISSGIKNIEYWIECDGKETKRQTLYSFDCERDNDLNSNGRRLKITDWDSENQINTETEEIDGYYPQIEQLRTSWSGTIIVDPFENNSSDVKVFVKTVDNAGNENNDTAPVCLDINMTTPDIKVVYVDTQNENAQSGYYTSRKAFVAIRDRGNHFDANAATKGIRITAKDAYENPVAVFDEEGNEIGKAYTISDWVSSKGETPDETIHTATIEYEMDANYEFDISYTDKAGNECGPLDIQGQNTPFQFVVDTVKPEGQLIIKDNVWNTILRTLTFGIYSNSMVDVKAEASDATSPISIEYYKTDSKVILTEEDLDKLEFEPFEEFNINPDELFTVYLKVTDYAGNYIYISSDGYILEDNKSNIAINPEDANENGIYGLEYENGISVDISITEEGISSGIKTVEYWIECDGKETKRQTLYSFDCERDNDLNSNGRILKITDWDSENQINVETEEKDECYPRYEQLRTSWFGTIIVNPFENNSSNVKVFVKTVDNAGNENSDVKELDIDVTRPEIQVIYTDKQNKNAEKGYYTSREATIVITERKNHFDANAATEGIGITALDGEGKSVAVFDKEGNELRKAYTISDWVTSEGDTPDETTHTATIKYEMDANYKFEISYTDKAGNVNNKVTVDEEKTPYEFTVDTVNPEGTVTAKSEEGREETWSGLIDSLRFGFWSNKNIAISGTSYDKTSPILRVQYYMPVAKNASDETVALKASDLDNISQWKDFSGFNVSKNSQFTVYLKITDCAGNYIYISTNGLIVDDQHPLDEVVAPEITVSPEKPVNGIYKDDVKVSIKVDDPMVGGTYSGLKEVSYKVFDRASATPNEATQEGILYSFNNQNPKQSNLLKTWTGEIVVQSSKNNSNDIQIVVSAIDNAGNYVDNSQIESQSYTVIKIDTTAPVIDISYNNNSAENEKYFKENRIATIRITERNFNPNDVKITITNTDGAVPAVVGWEETRGSYNQDNTVHTGTVNYNADGDYTFKIGYTDMAGNVCNSINYVAGTVAGEEFTIDKTIPKVNVSYDNNSAQNNNYYNNDRVATIVISEHNFRDKDVKITMTALDDGTAVSVPAVSGWSTNGDNHTARIQYSKDALYTFDIEYTDMAGNVTAEFAEQRFYIDKTEPTIEIEGVVNNSANSGMLAPIITYFDTNFDSNQVEITLVGCNRNSVELIGKYSSVNNGARFTFEDFKREKEIDDIYVLTVTLTDKAGNKSTEIVNFSVNRFGSTYALSEKTKKLNGSFVKKANDVVVTEVNADELKNIKITLFKNNETILLKEKTDYKVEVEGGNGEWYKYTYTIFDKNFVDDGVYRITIHSEDTAGNVAENTLDTKETEVGFGVDKTIPTINVKNLENGKTYAVDSMTVNMSVNDNLKLSKVIVYLDGEEYKVWEKEELESIIINGDDFKIDIPGTSTEAHSIKVVSIDAAGNENFENVEDFYVTTNVWVRYYNNKPVFFGSIGGSVAVAVLGILLVVFKRRKKEKK